MGKAVLTTARKPSPSPTGTAHATTPAPPSPIRAKPGDSPDIATPIEHASRHGHDFARVRVSGGAPVAAGSGQRLPETLRRTFEGSFGTDFSDVRLHRDPAPSEHDADAIAYHRDGRAHIHLAPDASRTGSRDGRKLLAHELAHVIQQRAGGVGATSTRGVAINDRPELESEAEALAEKAASGEPANANAGQLGKTAPGPGGSHAPSVGTTPIQAKGKSKSWQRRRRARIEEQARQRQAEREAAATKIQAAWRGHQSRKETYPLRSLHKWAKDLAAEPEDRQNADNAYKLYSKSTPNEKHAQMSPKEQKGHIEHLSQIRKKGEALVYPQGDNKKRDPVEYMSKKGEKKATNKFAYRFFSTEKQREKKPESSRLTVNIKPSSANGFADVLADTVTQESTTKGGIVRQAKIMGPANIGQRTDDAVVYLNGTDPGKARTLAGSIQDQTPGMRVRHSPPGMESMAPGVSYAETKPGGRSSHGSERSKIVADAVQDAKQTVAAGKSTDVREALPQALRRAIDKHGYDPDNPSRIKRP
jgi:hypothetical protein